MIPQQGDIFWVRFADAQDSSPSGLRPGVVIQNDVLNRSNLRTTVLSLLTSNTKLASVTGNIWLKKGSGNLPKSSVVIVSQIVTVDKGRLLEKIGTLGKEATKEIVTQCRKVISLSLF